MTYEEFLKAEGASDEDIKLLNTPIARKAFDKQQSLVAAAAEEQKKAKELVERNREWAEQVETTNQGYLKERDSALLRVAAAEAKEKELQRLGLLEVAERMEPGVTQPKPGETPAFDASKYVDRDTLMQVAEKEGEAIATAQDIAYEHRLLFPDKPLNFRELRREAVSRKMPLESLWMERFNVSAARDARNAAEKAAYEKKIAEDAIVKYKSEHPETNPLMAHPVISSTPFSTRVASSNTSDKTPWLKSDGERESARINKVLPKLEGLVH
jgi:hypothetical protein